MWKRDKWEYVNFSRSTTKKNPKMIIREYEYLIKNLEEKLETYKDKRYNIRITSTEFAGLTSNQIFDLDINFDISIDFLQLEMLYKRAVKTEQLLVDTFRHLESIKAELRRFKQIYYENLRI